MGKAAEVDQGRTARLALLAAMPGLALTGVAAAGSTSLAIRTDLILSLLDFAALLAAAWATAAGRRAPARSATAPDELVSCLVGISMLLSMAAVAVGAVARMAAGGVEVSGFGALVAIALNASYALVNGSLALRWYRQDRRQPSSLARAQFRLFADKVSSNLLIVLGLGGALLLEDYALARHCDPLAGLAMAAMSAWWAAPVVRRAAGRLQARRRTALAAA